MKEAVPTTHTPDISIRVERPAKTLRERALDKVRDALESGHFKPGERLVERDLCAQLGVSRTIVREVLRHLESEGLVSNQANRGPIVAQLDIDEAQQIYEIRGVLEGMAAKLCAERHDPAIIAELEEALQAIREAYGRNNMAGVLSSTTLFYQILFTKIGRNVAWDVVKLMTVRINHLRSMTIRTADRSVSGPAEMESILDAIRRGDGSGAYQAALNHVVSAAAIAATILTSKDRKD